MKSFYLILLCIFFSIPIFSQTNTKEAEEVDQVLVCTGKNFEAFHSDKRCTGLDNCTDSLQTVLYDVALDSLGRKLCCICWENPGKDCVNDNPDAYVPSDNEYEDEEDDDYYGETPGIYVDDWWWWGADGGPYWVAVMAVGSVVLLSNEVYVGASYPYLPPRLSSNLRLDVEPAVGVDLMFRKNLKRDAFEYGFNYHTFDLIEETNAGAAITSERERLMWVVSYLHNFNQHFYNPNGKENKVKFFAGPLVTFGVNEWNEDNRNEFGVGGIVTMSFPLSKRVFIDVRSQMSNYSSEIKLGLRWRYQEKYPWQKRRR